MKFLAQNYDCEITEVVAGGSNFPKLLEGVVDKPGRLFVMGRKNTLTKFFVGSEKRLAVVGTRKMSFYGRTVTERLICGVCRYGVSVVSGLMYGVDETALAATIENRGFAVGVWAGGIDTLFGTGRERIAKKVLSNGVLVSEYVLGFVPKVWSFPARNRIIAGLSDAVLVTEAALPSGSLITAGVAAELGRDVMAVPGPVTSSQSAGVNYLLRSGATLVSSTEDILECLRVEKGELPVYGRSRASESGDEKKILEVLGREGCDFDTLAREIGIKVAKLSTVLTVLELEGVIEKIGGKYFLKAK